MIDEEVETVLREIRERVRSAPPRSAPAASTSLPVPSNGDGELPITIDASNELDIAETLARLDAYLMATARSWDQLPPIVSNRSGAMARLELWIKAKSRAWARWFTWEQVNFNAAVHHAICNTRQSLVDYDVELRRLRSQLHQEAEVRQKENGARRKEYETWATEAAVRAKEAEAHRIEI
jgi:hypothetical protein